jgi:archaellum component FlaC
MNKENEKIEYVMRKDMEEQTQVILGAMDSMMKKQMGEIREELYLLKKEIREVMKQIKKVIKEKINLKISAI